MYRHKPLAKEPEQYFSTDKIMLVDSAFIPPKNVVPCFKKQAHKVKMPKAKERFNTIIAKLQASSKHTIGMLKCHFYFLQLIRCRIIEDDEFFGVVLKYVCVVIILHNLLIG